MKLKKIASLALAGIMAVSMLAGCKDGGNSNSGSSSSEPTAPTGYTATIYDLTSAQTKSVLKTKENATLTAAMDAVEAVFQPGYINKYKTAGANGLVAFAETGSTESGALYAALKSKLGANYTTNTITSGNYNKMNGTTTNTDKTYVGLYCISSALNDSNINKEVATEVNRLMEDVKNNTVNGDTVDWYLTVDKFAEGTTNDGATIVMIAIERATTKA